LISRQEAVANVPSILLPSKQFAQVFTKDITI